jgi:hypothetical protein
VFGLLDGRKEQIADLGSGEGKNWLLEHQFQTHPKDSIFIFSYSTDGAKTSRSVWFQNHLLRGG